MKSWHASVPSIPTPPGIVVATLRTIAFVRRFSLLSGLMTILGRFVL